MANITGFGPPTDFTQGNIGDIYRNMSNDVEYECVDIHEIRSDRPVQYYTWVRVKSNANLPSDNPGQTPTVSSNAIIDVIELPTENINENAFYRLVTGTMCAYGGVMGGCVCHIVNELPSIGSPMFDFVKYENHFYYSTNDGEVHCYIDSVASEQFGIPSGWELAATVAERIGMPYSGVVTSVLDIPDDGSTCLLLEYTIYSYKGGWISHETIGYAGAVLSAEAFNDPANQAIAPYSHAEGQGCRSEGQASHAEGIGSVACGQQSHAEGNSYAYGEASHAEGIGSDAYGQASHAEGIGSVACGQQSHAEGFTTYARGYASHAEGNGSRISKHITGVANATTYSIDDTDYLFCGASINFYPDTETQEKFTATIVQIDGVRKTVTLSQTLSTESPLKNASVEVYCGGMALGNNSHSEGNGTVAAGRSQHTQGEHNMVDPEYDVMNDQKRGRYAHIVGNGTSNAQRSNAHTLDWSGNAWYQGDVYVGGTGQDDAIAEKLAKLSDLTALSNELKAYIDDLLANNT